MLLLIFMKQMCSKATFGNMLFCKAIKYADFEMWFFVLSLGYLCALLLFVCLFFPKSEKAGSANVVTKIQEC